MAARKVFAGVLSALHAAALDDTLWPAASARIDDAVGAMGGTLLVGEGLHDDVRVVFVASYWRGERRPELEREYLHDYHPWDERVPRIRNLPDGRLVHVAGLYTDEERRTSRTYNEFLARRNLHDSLNVRLDCAPGTHITWGIANPARSGGWHSEQLAMAERLLPHVRHFVRTRQVMVEAQAVGSSLSALLDNTGMGIIHLGRSGRIVEANDRALAILARSDGLSDQGGYLGAWLPTDDARLQRLLAEAIPPSGVHGVAGSMTIGRPSNLPRLVLHVSPVDAGRPHVDVRRTAALVMVVEPESPQRLDARLVGEVLGLTAAESEVAVMLSLGRRVRDIAVTTGRKPGTVHDLIKRANKRLGISRQVDLVRRVLQLADLSSPQDGGPSVQSNRTARVHADRSPQRVTTRQPKPARSPQGGSPAARPKTRGDHAP